MDVLSTIIRTEIDIYDRKNKTKEAGEQLVDNSQSESDNSDSSDSDPEQDSVSSPRVIHGSLRPSCSLSQLETAHSSDAAFRNARIKLSDALAKQLNVSRVTLRSSDTVS